MLFECDRLKPALAACGFKELNCQSFELKMRSDYDFVAAVDLSILRGELRQSLHADDLVMQKVFVSEPVWQFRGLRSP